MSMASCTDPDASMAKPVARVAMTSEWSPKMDSAWAARERAATWMATGDLVHIGDHQQQSLGGGESGGQCPACTAPCTAPDAPPSLCISMISGIPPQMFFFPCADHSSENSPMGDAGVMG